MSKPPPLAFIELPDWLGGSSPDSPTSPTEVPGSGELFAMDPNDLFEEAYMDGIVDMEITGAGSDKLNSAMEELSGNPSEERVEELLAEIVEARGGELTMEEARAQYDKFTAIREAAAAREDATGDDIPDVNTIMHPDFLGSTASLRFGSVVGDAFGLDPVFGAMLSPTGGMVGPGNLAIHPDDDDPTGYHGIVHDAAGYLYNYHGEEGADGKWKGAGPGYDYLDEERHRDTGNPLTGQQSGMRHWHEKLNPGAETDEMLSKVDWVAETYDDATQTWEDVKGGAEEVYKDASEAASDFVDWAGDGLDSAGETISDTLSEGYDTASEAASDFVDWAGDGLDSAGEAISDTFDEGYDTASEAVSDTIDFFGDLLS